MSDSSAAKKPVSAVDEAIVVVCSPGKNPAAVIAPFEKLMSQTKGVDFKKTQTTQGAIALAQKSKKIIGIICVGDKTELMSALTFLAAMTPRISVGTVRVIIINKITHPKIPLMLKGKGASEVLDYQINQKAMSFKFNTYLKLVHQAYEKKVKNESKLPVQKGTLGSNVKGSSSKVALSQPGDSGAEIVWEKALNFKSDIWLVNSKKDVRCVLGRWLIHLVGPGPTAGNFEPSTLTFAGEKGWVWTPRKGKEKEFVKDEGKWVFFGRQPEFLWKSNVWSFVSNHPTLAFYVGEDATVFRMLCENGVKLMIPGNSESAKKLMPQIHESIQNTIKFKNSTAKIAQDDTTTYEEKAVDGASPGISDSEIMNVGGVADGWSESEAQSDEGGVLLGDRGNAAEDLDWSGVGKRPERAPAEKDEEIEPVLPETTEASEKDIATSSDGTPWKQGKDAFAVITLDFQVKSKNGAALIQPETVNLLEAQNLEAVMDAGEGQFKLKDKVVLLVKLTDGEAVNQFEIQSEVIRFEGTPDEGRQITVFGLDQAAESKVNNILKTYIDRQGELLEFFQTAKGA